MTRIRRSARFESNEHGHRTHACAPIDEDVHPEPCATLHDLTRVVGLVTGDARQRTPAARCRRQLRMLSRARQIDTWLDAGRPEVFLHSPDIGLITLPD